MRGTRWRGPECHDACLPSQPSQPTALLCPLLFKSERSTYRASLAMGRAPVALFDASLTAAFPARCGVDLAPGLGRLLHFRKPRSVARLALCLARQSRPHLALHSGDGVSLALAEVEQKGELSMTRKDRRTTARNNRIATKSCRKRALANSRARKPWRLFGRCGARLFGRAAERPLIEASLI
jgi:hypothetical protein